MVVSKLAAFIRIILLHFGTHISTSLHLIQKYLYLVEGYYDWRHYNVSYMSLAGFFDA